MYQLTYFANGKLHTVNSPSYCAIEELYFSMPRRMLPRFWRAQGKGRYALLA